MSYTTTFFENHVGGSRDSARRIASLITDLIQPRSVVDLGCATGTWLAAFQAQGAEVIDGYDGDYVDRSLLEIPVTSFHPVDLTRALVTPFEWPTRQYDLAVSLEVGEHLEPRLSEPLVDQLTRLASAVLFSAAIPRQSGTDHINERWQSEWAAIFARRGFYPHDVIRPAVWNDDLVEPWYAQNMLLYTREPSDVAIMDLVHPRLWEKNLRNAAVRPRLKVWGRKVFWRVVEVLRTARS